MYPSPPPHTPPPLQLPAQATIREALDRPHVGGPRLQQEGPLLPENRHPTHTPEAPPSTPTAEGRLTHCLPVATSPQARPKRQGARPETTQRGCWEEGPCQDCWAPD